MHTLRALVISVIFSVGVSAVAIEYSLAARDGNALQAANVCKVENEHCASNVECCASFYCAGRGAIPQDNKCHSDGILGGGTARCKDGSQCLTGKCENYQCTQQPEIDPGDDGDDGDDGLF